MRKIYMLIAGEERKGKVCARCGEVRSVKYKRLDRENTYHCNKCALFLSTSMRDRIQGR